MIDKSKDEEKRTTDKGSKDSNSVHHFYIYELNYELDVCRN